MKQYINMVKKVLEEGKWKSPVRKVGNTWEPVDGGIRTKACPNVFFSHDMYEGFPLLTTKKMAWKAIRVELEGFLKGITSKAWYRERNCKIWDEWANPLEVAKGYTPEETAAIVSVPLGGSKELANKATKTCQARTEDLGPIYGYQWRHFGEHYGPEDFHESEWRFESNGLNEGADQLKTIVDTLRSNPMDRRMVCSAWNPNQMDMMALPPCHYAWNVTVIDNKVNLFWAQRSADLMLGVPFNIASYGLLLSLLARDAGLGVGNLSACFVDCHIYENQLPGAYEQVNRVPNTLPIIEIPDNKQCLTAPDYFDIFDWTHDKVVLDDYFPLDKIDFGKVAV